MININGMALGFAVAMPFAQVELKNPLDNICFLHPKRRAYENFIILDKDKIEKKLPSVAVELGKIFDAFKWSGSTGAWIMIGEFSSYFNIFLTYLFETLGEFHKEVELFTNKPHKYFAKGFRACTEEAMIEEMQFICPKAYEILNPETSSSSSSKEEEEEVSIIASPATSYQVTDHDVDLICQNAECSKEIAKKYLKKNNGDIVDTVVDISVKYMKKNISIPNKSFKKL